MQQEFTLTESGTVKARARCGGVKIHGPNSPDVLTGRVKVGHREEIDFGENAEQLIELDRDTFASMFGEEKANEVFKGVTNG